MIGTIVNTCCIIIGSVAGSILRRGIKERYRNALFTALGMCTLLLGVNTFVHNMPNSHYPVLFIAAMAVGTTVGCAMRLERIREPRSNKGEKHGNCDISNDVDDGCRIGDNSNRPRLADGLTTGCLLYCIGTFSMLGPVMAALKGDNTYLFTNAALDLITSTVLAATYGIGMVWAAPVLFCSQTTIYVITQYSAAAISPELMTEISIIGGILITASGIDILRLRDCHTLQMLPALLVPPLFFLVKDMLQGIEISL